MKPPTCAHVHVTGRQCRAAALSGRTYCHFHQSVHQTELLPGNPNYVLPICEDSRSILIATQHVLQAQLKGLIDPRVATRLIYSLQAMARLIRQPDFAETAPQPAEPHNGGPRNMTEFVLKLLNDLPNRQHDVQPRPDDHEVTSTSPNPQESNRNDSLVLGQDSSHIGSLILGEDGMYHRAPNSTGLALPPDKDLAPSEDFPSASNFP